LKLTLRAFWAYRRASRLARKAEKAAARVPLFVVDAVTLEQMVRAAVADALASSQEEFVQEPAFRMSATADTAALPPAEESPVEEPFAEPVGAPPAQPVQPAQPAMSADEKRREFVRNFLRDQRAARGVGIPN
jgi:predicted pyridoxine 5'-phosphate oxidase superfamily flavin-nucleotide-binding protein